MKTNIGVDWQRSSIARDAHRRTSRDGASAKRTYGAHDVAARDILREQNWYGVESRLANEPTLTIGVLGAGEWRY